MDQVVVRIRRSGGDIECGDHAVENRLHEFHDVVDLDWRRAVRKCMNTESKYLLEFLP